MTTNYDPHIRGVPGPVPAKDPFQRTPAWRQSRASRRQHDPGSPLTWVIAKTTQITTTGLRHVDGANGDLAAGGIVARVEVRYPAVEAYETGMLDVGDGNRVYWETCGNPAGKPALVVHGGPGSGCGPGHRRSFDPARYRVVLFDQRMCGRSRPLADNPAVDLAVNTTDRLIADMERLRVHLGIGRWLLWGMSWGSTLLLAYAQRYPHRVTEIVISGVTMTRRSEIDWLYRGLYRFFPQEWERFRAGAGEAVADGDLIAAYGRLMADPDPVVRARAAAGWSAWEDATISLDPDGKPGSYSARPPDLLLARARLCAHYFAHGAWLEEGQLLAGAHLLAGIPGVLIQGRMDMGGLDTAWELARAWPGAELAVIERSGHSGSAEMTARQVKALDDFAAR